MSKTIITYAPEVEIEDWEYCYARNPQYNIQTGEASAFGRCRFCELGIRSFKCLLFDRDLETVAVQSDHTRRKVPKRCESCLKAKK